MAINLTIEKPGVTESVKITDVETATMGWRSVARGMKLKQFVGMYPMYINPTNISDALADFRAIRQACPAEPKRWSEDLDNLITRLERLATESNWTAELD